MDKATPAGRPAQPAAARNEFRELAVFLLKLAVFVFILRSFIISPFVIPSGSMLPRLLVGDFLFITKWNYGYSRHSLPGSLPLIPGRIFADDPERGDVVVFKAPPSARQDYIKRVIGLPGDSIQMRAGQLILNGRPIPKERIGDFVFPVTPNSSCPTQFEATDPAGRSICRYPQFRETLPGGRSYAVLDQGSNVAADDTSVYTVPAGHVFLMGDNRDDSSDSRFPAMEGGGIGYVPIGNLQGKAVVIFWSTDGSASWLLPWTWFSAARWERLGDGF